MAVLNLNIINDLVRQYYVPALERSAAEDRLHMERWFGMRNPMPFFDWWPWISKAVAVRTDAKSRLSRAWRELRTGDL